MLIYMATNTVTGLSYIGATSLPFYLRRRVHESGAKRGRSTRFHLALKEYGITSFEWRVLKDGILSKEELDNEEARFIRIFETFEDGYNATVDGKGGSHVVSEETRQRLSEAGKRRKPCSAETRQKLSESSKRRYSRRK